MQRARRLLSLTVVAVVGVLVLAGCLSHPDAAAYVGDAHYTQRDVDQVLDEIKDRIPPEQSTAVRQQVVTMLVMREVAVEYARAHDIAIPDADPAAFAQQTGLPPGTKFTDLTARFDAALTAVLKTAKPAKPTEADQREAHAHATVQGQPVTDAFEAVRQFFGEEQIGRAVGVRNLLNDAVNQADVSVNPRYGEVTYHVPVQIGQATSWLAVRLTPAQPVMDATSRPE